MRSVRAVRKAFGAFTIFSSAWGETYDLGRYGRSILLGRMLVTFSDLGVEKDHPLGQRCNSMERAVRPFGYYQLYRGSLTYRLVGGSGLSTFLSLMGASSSSESEY
jgi:hypothetical protein